jgi:hypothetical protein
MVLCRGCGIDVSHYVSLSTFQKDRWTVSQTGACLAVCRVAPICDVSPGLCV